MKIVLAIWIMINMFFLIFIAMCCDGYGSPNLSFLNPKVIYDNIPVNWFGAIFLSIIFNILLPLSAVIYWGYKLCTVGRKEK